MIEQIMYFMLGALSAGLLSLGILPAFWRRAERLVRQQLERQLPLSPREIAAERDALRAIHAVEHRRLELKSEAVAAARLVDQQKFGKKLLEIKDLYDRIAGLHQDMDGLRATIADRSDANDALTRRLDATETDLAAAQKTLSHQIMLHTQLQGVHRQAQQALEHERDTVAGLERELAEVRAALAGRESFLFDLQNRFETQTGSHADLQEAYRALAAQAEDGRLRIINLETRLEVHRAQQARSGPNPDRSEREAFNDNAPISLMQAELKAEIKVRTAAQKEALASRRRIAELEAQMEELKTESRATARDLVKTVESLKKRAKEPQKARLKSSKPLHGKQDADTEDGAGLAAPLLK